MKLSKLAAELPCIVYGKVKGIEVRGISYDSRLTAPGHIFVAQKGTYLDGNNYIQDALENGAVAILSDQYNPFFSSTVQMITDNVTECKAQLAAKFYGDPSLKLNVMGITGTNGKTTIAYMLKHVTDSIQEPCGLISTVEYLVGNHVFEGKNTTPDILVTQKLMKEMLKYGCQHVAMEISSFGLMQGRVKGLDIDVAIFTNLSPEHLDVHLTMENYAIEKRKLFSTLPSSKWAIFNQDSPWTEFMKEGCRAQICSYGLDSSADFYATDVIQQGPYLFFKIVYRDEEVSFQCSLIGMHNLYNTLATVAVCVKVLKVPLKKLPEIFSQFVAPPGRLEAIQGGPCSIFIDYAHTPDAFEVVLSALREAIVDDGRLILIFGCGGNKDKMKRPIMGAIAEKLADHIILTSDNPRFEDPSMIVEDIVKGFTNSSTSYIIELDRAKAIEIAIDTVSPNDILLIAGKGHERSQEVKRTSMPFSDKQVVLDFISRSSLGISS